MWYVYILETTDGRFYTGITDNINRRMREHKEGRGARFTRLFGFKRLLYRKSYPTRFHAEKRERQLKGWSRRKKQMLINGELH